MRKSAKALVFITFMFASMLNMTAYAADDAASTDDSSTAATDDSATSATDAAKTDDSATSATDTAKTDDSASTTTTTTKTEKTVTTAPASTGQVATPDASAPGIKTVMTDKVVMDKAVGEKSSFTKDTPEIFVTAVSDEVKPGQAVRSVWIAEDTNGVAPPNYQIDEKTLVVGKEMDKSKNWVATFSLSKPTAGWPLGKYHLDIYVDKMLDKSIPFTIK